MNLTAPHYLLINALRQLANRFDIPDNAKRIALNLRVTNYYQTRTGFHPVEIQLERDLRNAKKSEWSVVFIASFSYPDEAAENVDVELYFNFLRSWFYQPDIERCELNQPKVKELYQAYEQALIQQLRQRSFDDIQATLVSIDNGSV
ncbi:TPA: DUF2787 family protein [Vibrio alginolyticus]|uniref:DUF2787 family protein n=1 Tax=Vibrio alginolyticus TaxID=663 RepID=UPI00227747EE|nr:DUF2787 family protein [Vibrio alginolyticus]WAE55423.1 DUF2787 domain-containing protein [Vibrio alginolyticus]